MAITNKEALEAAEALKSYCRQHECSNCIFFVNARCDLGRNLPHRWECPSLSRWTKTDKALAEALKLAGAKYVFCIMDTGKLAISDGDKTLIDYDRLLDAFCDLKPGERISLEEIVNSKGERNDGE